MRVSEGLSCPVGYMRDEMLPRDNAVVKECVMTAFSVEEGVRV